MILTITAGTTARIPMSANTKLMPTMTRMPTITTGINGKFDGLRYGKNQEYRRSSFRQIDRSGAHKQARPEWCCVLAVQVRLWKRPYCFDCQSQKWQHEILRMFTHRNQKKSHKEGAYRKTDTFRLSILRI